MNHRVASLVARLKALNAQRAAVALELAEALGSDPGASLMSHAVTPDLGDSDPVDDVEPALRGRGRPLSERTRAILRFIKMRKKATAGGFAFLGLSVKIASATLRGLANRGLLVSVAPGTYALPNASESFAATLKKAVKATKGPGRRKGPYSAASEGDRGAQGRYHHRPRDENAQHQREAGPRQAGVGSARSGRPSSG